MITSGDIGRFTFKRFAVFILLGGVLIIWIIPDITFAGSGRDCKKYETFITFT